MGIHDPGQFKMRRGTNPGPAALVHKPLLPTLRKNRGTIKDNAGATGTEPHQFSTGQQQVMNDYLSGTGQTHEK
jgi:hypothetical protein